MSGMLRIDLRDGFRIETAALVMPAGQYEARLYVPKVGARVTWKQVGPMVVAGSPEQAATDMLTALNRGLLPGVEAAA